MSQAVNRQQGDVTIRPLSVLVTLIKEDWQQAQEAADKAAEPYWVAIGEKLAEAKGQLDRGEFVKWVKRNFKFGERQARKYMQIANATDAIENGRARGETLSDAIRATGGSPRGAERGGASWHAKVAETLHKVDVERLMDAGLKAKAEREAESKLGLQLIDIGFKALASKLHPDKGGSKEAMARLNHVRDRLKKFV